MKELNKNGENFSRLWEQKREKKWRYAFLHGSVYWGLPVALLTVLLEARFDLGNISISQLLISAVAFMAAGVSFGLYQFKRIDEMYLSLNDDSEIQKGIQTIESGKSWNYENLIINKAGDEMLNVQNQLLWLEEEDITSKDLEQCFNIVCEDFQRLKENKVFDQFIAAQKVRIQIVDNSDSKSLLLERQLA